MVFRDFTDIQQNSSHLQRTGVDVYAWNCLALLSGVACSVETRVVMGLS